MANGTKQNTDTQAVLALVLAVLVPPVGLAMAVFASKTSDRRLSNLRTLAFSVGLIGSLLLVMLGILWLAGSFSSSG